MSSLPRAASVKVCVCRPRCAPRHRHGAAIRKPSQKPPLAQEYAHLPMRIVIEGTAGLRTRVGDPGNDHDRPACGILTPEYFEQAVSVRETGVESLMPDFTVQNIPLALARGMFGAINGAEFFGSPTICKVSQCSMALPSTSIL